jgi:cyclophilin family peptidyl-prolyl cis-trans isomerase
MQGEAGDLITSLDLRCRHAPKTTKNFEELARRGYYDGTIVSSCGVKEL